ncbi:MAG: GspE/PulE family protein [Hyphomonadaceae bacterium]
MRRLEEILLERGLVSAEDLHEAAELGGPLTSTLVRLGAVSEADVLNAASQHLSVPLLHRDATPETSAVLDAVARLRIPPRWLAEREAIVWFEGEALYVAARRIDDLALHDAIEQWGVTPTRLLLVNAQMLEPFMHALDNERAETGEASGIDPQRLMELAEEAPTVNFVNSVFSDAIAQRASDVHFEPFEDKLIVRLRIDGVLREWRSAPRSSFDAISSRVKLLSGMDIAERRLPQDGRQRIRVAGRDLDVRVSTLPVTWGESIVVRPLGAVNHIPPLDQLGLDQDQRDTLIEAIHKPNGLILVSGPTGSGKTTTVYRLLSEINDGVRKIVTIEDPVEIDAPGALQMRVRPEIGLDFAAGLRSILRQDPDVIFVGEIRDAETAKTAVRAALTGHLVISTVHTNSAHAAVARLLDLGVEEFLLAEVLRVVAGQRLLRRVCPTCSTAADHEARFRAIRPPPPQQPNWRDAQGCRACSNTGYLGRFGVFETSKIDGPMQEAIHLRRNETELANLARTRGFRSLLENAMMRARTGETTFAEALRTVGV